MADIPGLALRVLSVVFAWLFLLLLRVDFTTPWAVAWPQSIGDEAHRPDWHQLFHDYLFLEWLRVL